MHDTWRLLVLWQVTANERAELSKVARNFSGPLLWLGIGRYCLHHLAYLYHGEPLLPLYALRMSKRFCCEFCLLNSSHVLSAFPCLCMGPISIASQKWSDKLLQLNTGPPTSSIYTNAMRISQLWACLLALCAIHVSATALTYKMQPNEKSCFFAWVDQKPAKIAFYFAVCRPFPHYI